MRHSSGGYAGAVNPMSSSGFGVRSSASEQFIALINAARASLEDLYASNLEDERMRQEKSAVIERLRRDYRALGENYPFRAWMQRPINNAKLGTVVAYNRWVPAFLAILKEEGGDMLRFLERVEVISQQDESARNTSCASKNERPAA
ncbi:MAG: aminopeptidase [Gammaproteobacteria bacterium]|nr:aminopeptidase [Gammaproteobacteria bacterium]